MITIVIAVTIAGYAICTLIFFDMVYADTKFARNKYEILSKLGSQFNLSFSSHLVLNNQLIALDGVRRILLVADASYELDPPCIIELTKVISISVKKSYGSIKPGELNSKGFEEFLERIELHFDYSNGENISLLFYDFEKNDVRDLPRLDRNARNWQMILTKMTGLPGLVRIPTNRNNEN